MKRVLKFSKELLGVFVVGVIVSCNDLHGISDFLVQAGFFGPDCANLVNKPFLSAFVPKNPSLVNGKAIAYQVGKIFGGPFAKFSGRL